MLSNYGFEDASGAYYISINTDDCCRCEEKPCVAACPAGLFEIQLDDFDDEVAMIGENVRNQIRQKCVVCKNAESLKQMDNQLPCVGACSFGAIGHTW